MKRITLKKLPEILTEDIIEILVEMALEEPKTTFDWYKIFDYLIENDYPSLKKILDRVEIHQKAIIQAKEDAKSEEQKNPESFREEKAKWEEAMRNVDPNQFYGNMGEPTTVQEYKNKYGVWPPGYDNNGNKL